MGNCGILMNDTSASTSAVIWVMIKQLLLIFPGLFSSNAGVGKPFHKETWGCKLQHTQLDQSALCRSADKMSLFVLFLGWSKKPSMEQKPHGSLWNGLPTPDLTCTWWVGFVLMMKWLIRGLSESTFLFQQPSVKRQCSKYCRIWKK